MCQLQCQLDEGIGARPALLDQPFAKVVKWEGMQVHIICQKTGAVQGSLYDLLTLQGKREAPSHRGSMAEWGRAEPSLGMCISHSLQFFWKGYLEAPVREKYSISSSPCEQWGN